jgi:hypothetical protein
LAASLMKSLPGVSCVYITKEGGREKVRKAAVRFALRHGS